MNIREALLLRSIIGGGGIPQEKIDEIAVEIGISIPSTPDAILAELDDIIDDANEVTGEQSETLTESVQALIDGYGGGGVTTVKHGVQFIDYDGSIVTTWDASEVASKTALPDNPTHDGLVAQGWNWTLDNIKSYIANYSNALITVGQMYKTTSGLTEIDITLTKVTGLAVTCKMSGTKNWGDGTTDTSTSHTYTQYGDYTITCNGTTIPAGSNASGGMFGTTSSNMNRFWCTAIRIGEDVTSIGNYAFFFCYSLTNITIPQGVTSIGNNVFANCYSITSITIPQGVTSIGDTAFYYCYSLTSITIPQSVTSIGTGAFYFCYSITSITIPQSVPSIGNGAFYYCCSILEYDFSSATSVPTLSNANAFIDINGICKIIVPDALYNDWIVATNWATYANYIYKASEV